MLMVAIIAADIFGAIFYKKTPKITAKVEGEELIFYRYKEEPLRVKAQDIVAATSIVDRRNLFYGSVAVELANGEKLYYHSILNADGLAVNIERWKHQQLVKQLNKAQKSSLDKAEDNEYVNEKQPTAVTLTIKSE